ncbi:MAG: molybdopterin-dependent oxidoreductase [Magnetococcales bacterium]|nr:molybdopterin-dependent oxidoreductase [Magnetococcales bacterium]
MDSTCNCRSTVTEVATIRTTCPYCGTGCGLLVTSNGDGGIASLQGDPDHPANRGWLCSKGISLPETMAMDGRLQQPMVHGRPTSWDAALQQVANGFRDTLAQYGPQAVAFYVSGQLLTEDYYLANKLIKGFMGSANIDSNSRLCMASAVVGHKRAFGSDFVPCRYQDLEEADLLVVVGSNTAWCHPVLFRRMMAARQKGSDKRLVVIDPRCTATAQEADLHLAIQEGSDLFLWLGLLHYLHQQGALDQPFLRDRVQVDAEAFRLAAQQAGSPAEVARQTGVSEEQIMAFFELFRCTPRTVTLFSQGINQSEQGSDQVSAIINLHLATGRIGQPGMGPFSLTGQPNAMGGREVGALATLLAAHLEIENPEHRQLLQTFWDSPVLPDQPGRKAVDLFQDVADGIIKAIWIMGTNPLVSLPDPDAAAQALQRCPLVVVSDPVAHTETSQMAHILLPAQTWGEKEGTVSNSERCISRQRAFLPPFAEAKPDWWIIQEVARRMGFGKAFAYQEPAEIFQEYARLTAWKNQGERLLNLSGLARLTSQEYAELPPVVWPVMEQTTESLPLPRWPLPEGKARLLAVAHRPRSVSASAQTPLRLSTGRVRDHWHTMTRTGVSPRLSRHAALPTVEIHPQDALPRAIDHGQLVQISGNGTMLAKAVVTKQQRAGSLFVPMHWSSPFAYAGKCNVLLSNHRDPHSGQPGFKLAYAEVKALSSHWQGLLLSRQPLRWQEGNFWWARQPLATGIWLYSMEGLHPLHDWTQQSREWLQEVTTTTAPEWIDYSDSGSQRFRSACLHNGRILAAVYLGNPLPDPETLMELFALEKLADKQRMQLMLGSSIPSERSRTICACGSVTEAQILQTIASQPAITLEEIGQTLKAGIHCGSCRSEIKTILAQSIRY